MLLTSLDLLVIVVMILVAMSVVAMALMFLVKNRKVRRVCLWIVAALGLYMSYVGLRIMWGEFLLQSIVSVLTALAAVAAVVLERASKGDEKLFPVARLLAAAALVIGFFAAFS